MADTTKDTTDTTPEKVEYDIETGVDSTLPFSLPYNPAEDGTKRYAPGEVPLHEVHRGTWGEDEGPSVRQLVTMRRQDGQARALYRLLTLPIRSALNTATFVPADGGDEERDFIDAVFHTPAESGGMTVTFQRFMSQLLQGLFDGFSAFEKVYWIPETGPMKGKVTLKKVAYRPSETVAFVTDDHGNFEGIRQRTSVAGKVTDTFIPRDYVFYWAAQEEERKFYGVSFFQSAFYHYDKKVKLYYTAHLAAQRAAVGTRIGTVPSNAGIDAKANFRKMLANMSVAQWMMVPDGFKVEILKESGGFDFLSLINHHNSQMSKSLLANFFDQAQGGGASDTSLVNFASPGDDMFVLMLRAIMDDIANQINHYIIPQLIDFNFKGGKYPKFVWGKLTDEQRAAISSVFDKIVAAGQQVNLPPEFVRALEIQQADQMGLEIDWDAVEEREKAQSAAGQPGAPGAAPGAPVAPPAPTPGSAPGGAPQSPDDLLSQFEQSAATATPSGAGPAQSGSVGLSDDSGSEDLLRLAMEVLDAVG